MIFQGADAGVEIGFPHTATDADERVRETGHHALCHDIGGALDQADIDERRDVDPMHDMWHAGQPRGDTPHNSGFTLVGVDNIGTDGPEHPCHVPGGAEVRQGVDRLDEALDALEADEVFEPGAIAGIMVPTMDERDLVSEFRLAETRCDDVLLRSRTQKSCHDMHNTKRRQNRNPTMRKSSPL